MDLHDQFHILMQATPRASSELQVEESFLALMDKGWWCRRLEGARDGKMRITVVRSRSSTTLMLVLIFSFISCAKDYQQTEMYTYYIRAADTCRTTNLFIATG